MHCPSCGTVFEVGVPEAKGKRRSRPQECRLHALARAAYHQWPESAQFRPKSAENLRYWLTVEAGFFDVVRQALLPPDIEKENQNDVYVLIAAFLRASADDNMFVDIDGRLLTARRAKSTVTMEHREYNALSTAIDELLLAEGLHPDKLLRERAA